MNMDEIKDLNEKGFVLKKRLIEPDILDNLKKEGQKFFLIKLKIKLQAITQVNQNLMKAYLNYLRKILKHSLTVLSRFKISFLFIK